MGMYSRVYIHLIKIVLNMGVHVNIRAVIYYIRTRKMRISLLEIRIRTCAYCGYYPLFTNRQCPYFKCF